jgi:hypothetical protein
VEARLWQAETPWLDSVQAARPFWLLRTLSAIPITAGFVALFTGLTTGPRGPALRASDSSIESAGGRQAPELTPMGTRI